MSGRSPFVPPLRRFTRCTSCARVEAQTFGEPHAACQSLPVGPRRPAGRARALVAMCVLAACGAQPAASPAPSPGVSASPTTIATTTPITAPSPSSTTAPECAVRVLSAMTEDQRIGQLFLLGLANDQLGA